LIGTVFGMIVYYTNFCTMGLFITFACIVLGGMLAMKFMEWLA